MPKPELTSISFSQRVWKSIPAKTLTKRDCEFVSISKHFTKILTGCHEADGAVRWDLVLTSMPNVEQTQNWNKENWIDALSCSADRMEYSEDQKRNDYLHSCRKRTQSRCVTINPTLFSLKKILKVHILHTGSSSTF